MPVGPFKDTLEPCLGGLYLYLTCGILWSLWAFVGVSGRLWTLLGASGVLWALVAGSGRLWMPVGGSRRLWVPLGACGRFWTPLDALGRALGACGCLWTPVGASGRLWGRQKCVTVAEAEQPLRAGLPPIPVQNGHSVRDCRRSQATTAIPCKTVADPRLKRQFRVGVATIPGQTWRQLHSFGAVYVPPLMIIFNKNLGFGDYSV